MGPTYAANTWIVEVPHEKYSRDNWCKKTVQLNLLRRLDVVLLISHKDRLKRDRVRSNVKTTGDLSVVWGLGLWGPRERVGTGSGKYFSVLILYPNSGQTNCRRRDQEGVPRFDHESYDNGKWSSDGGMVPLVPTHTSPIAHQPGLRPGIRTVENVRLFFLNTSLLDRLNQYPRQGPKARTEMVDALYTETRRVDKRASRSPK